MLWNRFIKTSLYLKGFVKSMSEGVQRYREPSLGAITQQLMLSDKNLLIRIWVSEGQQGSWESNFAGSIRIMRDQIRMRTKKVTLRHFLRVVHTKYGEIWNLWADFSLKMVDSTAILANIFSTMMLDQFSQRRKMRTNIGASTKNKSENWCSIIIEKMLTKMAVESAIFREKVPSQISYFAIFRMNYP